MGVSLLDYAGAGYSGSPSKKSKKSSGVNLLDYGSVDTSKTQNYDRPWEYESQSKFKTMTAPESFVQPDYATDDYKPDWTQDGYVSTTTTDKAANDQITGWYNDLEAYRTKTQDQWTDYINAAYDDVDYYRGLYEYKPNKTNWGYLQDALAAAQEADRAYRENGAAYEAAADAYNKVSKSYSDFYNRAHPEIGWTQDIGSVDASTGEYKLKYSPDELRAQADEAAKSGQTEKAAFLRKKAFDSMDFSDEEAYQKLHDEMQARATKADADYISDNAMAILSDAEAGIGQSWTAPTSVEKQELWYLEAAHQSWLNRKKEEYYASFKSPEEFDSRIKEVDAELTEIDKRIDDSKSAKSDAAKAATAAGNPFYNFDDTQLKADRERKKELQHEREQLALHRDNFAGASMWDGWNEDAKKAYRDYQSFYDFYQSTPNADTKADMESALIRVQKLTGLSADALEKNRQGLKLMTEQAFASDLEAQKRAFAQEHPEAARWGGSVVDNAFGVVASADLLGQYLLKSVGAQDYIDTNNQTQTIANSSQWVQDEISKGLANGTMSKNLIGVSAKDVQDRVGLGAGYAKFMYETKAPEFLGQGNLAQVTAGWESSAIDNTVRNVLTLASMCGAAAFADAAGEMTAKMIWDTARSGSYSELAGKVTGLMMGGKVFASEAKRLLDQGVPSDRAIVAAGVSSAIEGLSEKYNIEAMLGEGATMGKPAWQRLAMAALFEGTEELESNWMSPIASWAETGELNSRIELTYKELVSQGADPKDALTAAYMSIIDEDIASFTAGAFSAMLPGVISSGTRGTISTFQNKNSQEYKASRATIKTSLEATLNESKWHNEQYGVTEDTGEVASYINRHGQVSIIDSNGEYIIKRVPRLGDAKVEKTTYKDFSKARAAAAEIIMNKMGGQNAAIAAAARDRESFVTGRQERDFNEIMLTQDEVSQQIAKLAETPFARKSDRFNMEESIKASAAVAAVESGRRRLNDTDLLAVVKALRLDKSPAMQNFMADRYRIATGNSVSGPITADNALSILREMNDAAVQTYAAQHRAGQLRMSEEAIAKSEKSFRALKALKDFRSRAAEKSAQVGDMLNAAVDDITKQDAAKAAERTNGDTTTVNGETMTKSEFMANAEMQALAEDSGISMDDLYKAFHDSVVMVESSVDYDSLTEIQLASMDMLELLGEKFGLRFHMYDSSKFARGEKRYGKNGFYTSGGDIYIDVNAGTDGKATILYTATHEMLHFLKTNSPALYTEIAAWIHEYGIPDDASFNELMNVERDLQLSIGIDVAKEEEADPTFIEEEVIADALSEALTSKRAQDLLSNLSDLSSEAGKAMSDQFADTAAKVRELYKGVKPSTKAGRYMEQMATSINDVSEMFVKALKEVAALKDSDRSETAETTNATTDANTPTTDANTPTTDANTSNTDANTSNTDANTSNTDATADATSATDVTTSQEDADFNYEMSGYESYVRGLMNAMTPAAANEILRNPNYADAWESLSGEKLVGSNNQKRDQIMKGQIRNEWLRFSLKDDVQTAEEAKLDYDLDAINEALYRRIEDGSAGGDDDDYATAFHDLELRALKLDPAIEERQDELSAQYTNEEAFLDSDTFARFSIRPPYSDTSKDFARFRSELNDEARQTMDLFYNVFKSAQLTNAKSLTGKAVKNINIAATYMTVDAWNDMLSKDKQWSDGAKSIVRSILQTEGLLDNGKTYSDSQVQEAAENSKIMRNMRLNWDGSLNPDALEQNFGEEGKQLQLSTSLMQRLVDSLPLERIDATYTMLGDGKDHADKTITLPAGRARQSVGGEAYRRAITNETRKAYFKGKLKPVSISAMHKDRWGSLGFLAENGKTGASGDLTTLCPQMMYNRGCFYCYRRASMETGVNNKLVARSVWYTGEILRLKDSDVKRLNKVGGLRIQSFGDWMPQFSAQMADILYDAELRGLQVKIITKEPSMVEYIAALREQGIGLNLYFNLSADYVIEKAPNANNSNGESLEQINPDRPYYRDESGQMWWKRALTVEEVDVYRQKYPWVNCRIVAHTREQFLRGLKDSRVDVVTGYHGKLRSVEYIDSVIGDGENKRILMIEPMGDAGMPRFTYDQMSQEWTTAFPGKTKTHQSLAADIQKEGLEAEYVAKTCCLTGRCASCIGLCGKTGQSFIARNATNRDAEGAAWWVEHLTYADESIMDETDVPATWMDYLTSLTEDGNEKMLRWFDDAERKLADLARNQQVQVAQDGVASAENAIKTAQNAVRKAEKKYKESPTEENRAKVDEKRQALAQRQSELPEAQTALADVEKWNADTAATRSSLRDTGDYAPTFYSQMSRVIDGIKDGQKLGAASVVSYLRGRGVKAEEIKWSGIEEWLQGKKSVTKQELQEFAAGSQLEIEEVSYDRTKDWDPYEAFFALEERVQAQLQGKDYADYDLNTESPDPRDWTAQVQWLDGTVEDVDLGDYRSAMNEQTRWSDFTLPGGSNYRELLFKLPNSDYTNMAMSTHWGEDSKGVLAHARVQDMISADTGVVMLFIDEIQSDWHNAGAKYGYATQGDRDKSDALLARVKGGDAAIRTLESQMEPKFSKEWSGILEAYMAATDREQGAAMADLLTMPTDALTRRYSRFLEADPNYADYEAYVQNRNKLTKENDDLYEKWLDIKVAPGAVQDAPFKDNYHEFVLKRLIRDAAEKGYGDIGWTTAQQQSDRWSDAYAEGYRIEYDQDIPSFLKKYGKKWGAVVDQTTLENGETVWHMNIPGAMRQSVLYEGQPRFSVRDSDDEDRNDERYAELAKNPDKNHRALQNMVRAAAKAAGFTIHGYHGTPAFGFTQFDPNRYVFITEDEGIARGYSRSGYPARRRDVASAYVDDDGTDDTLIRNSKNVLGVDLTTSTPEKVDATLSDLRSRLLEGQRELDELGVLDIDLPENMTDREQEAFWNVAGFQGELADQLTDVLAATEDREWREENLEQQIHHYYSEAVLEENRDVLMDYYGRNQQMLRDRGLDEAFSQVIFGVNASYNRIDVASVLVPLITNPSNTLITEDGKRVYDKTDLRGRIEQAKGAGSYELFGNPGDNPLVVDADGHMWDAVSYDGKYWTTDKLAAWAQENGYTSVTVKNVRDSLLNLTENRPQTEHIFFNNDQVKSADPVTYDESGSVIPISERFNSNQTDIRYSIRDDSGYVPTKPIRDLMGSLEESIRPATYAATQNSSKDYGDMVEYQSKAILKASTLDYYLSSSGFSTAGSPNYSKAYLAYMSPDDFLRLTTKDTAERDRIYSQTTAANMRAEDAVARSPQDPIYLRINQETGEVVGHEGRHRMLALALQGVQEVPVLLVDETERHKNNKQIETDKLLTGQFNPRETAIVREAIPVNSANKEQLTRTFATQSGTQRLNEAYSRKPTLRMSLRDNTDKVEAPITSTNTANTESKVSRTWKAKLQETPEWQKFAENYAARFGDDALREDYGTVDQINRMAARMKRNAEISEQRKNEAVAGRKLAETALKAAQAEARAKDIEQRRQAAFRARQDQKTEAAWVRDAQGYEDRLASLEKSGQRKAENSERKLQATREHDKLMAERKMYRVLFRRDAAKQSDQVRTGRSLAEQRRKVAEVKAAGKRSLANYKALHARGVLESRGELNARRNRDTYDYDPNNAEFNTLRNIEGEAAATGMDKVRKIAQDVKAKAVSMALGFEKSLVNSLQYLDKFDRMQGAAGMEGNTVSVLTKAAAVYNSTVQTNLHDHLVNPDGDIVGDSFSDTFLCWNADHTAIDREQQAVLQDIMLNLDNISRQSAVSTAWNMLQQFEEKNAWLTHVTNQEFAELVASRQEREDIAARDRQLKEDLSKTKSIAEAERLQKQYDADVEEIRSHYEANHRAQEYAKLMRNYRNAKKSSASKVIFTDSNGKAITAESSQKVIESYRQSNPDLFQKVDAIQAWWDQFMRDWAVGVSISEDEYEIMRQMRPYYAPTHRIGKGVGGAASAQGTGLSTQKQVKGLTGSDRQIMNIEDQFYEMMQSIVRAKRLNDVYGSIVNTALDNPDGAFTGVAEYDYDYDEGQTDLLYDPEDIVDTQISEDLLNDGNGYTVTYWENGQRHRAYIDQDLYESLFNLADKHTGSKAEKLVDTLTKAGNALTSPMKAMITGTNPLFAIRNVMRDIPTAYINSVAGLRFGKYWTQALKELHHSDNWDHFAALGGEQMGYYRNENAHKQNTDNLLKYFEKEANPSLMKKFGDKWTYLAEASESVTRFAEYLATLDLLGGDTTENRLQGIKNAAEVTVDFSRRGTAGSLINAWVPYWNPAVQGVSKVVRSVIGDDRTWQGVAKQAGTTLTKALVVSAGPEILMYLLRHMVGKEEDYEELSDYIKDNYFCIPMAGNTWFKIPKNREWAALLGTPLNRILQGLDGRSDIWEGYVEDNLEANFLPGTMSVKGTGIPDPLGLTNAIGVSQMLDLLDNTNFAGSPIVSSQFKDYSTGEWASNQYIYDKNTSLVAYGMARLLGDKLSPIQMDYIMQSYMGDFYSMLNGLVDMGLVDGDGTVSENVVDAMRDVRNSWVVDSRYSNSTTAAYYSAMDDLTKQITDLRVQSNGDEYKDSIEYRTKQALTKLGKNLSALSKQARDMQDGREKDAVKGQVVQAAGELLDFYDRCMAGDIEDPETYAELYDYSGTVRDGLMQFSREQLTTAKVMPATSAPTSYADERRKGYTYYLNSDQREVYMDLYSQAYDDAVRKLLGSSMYRAANDEGKLEMLSDIKSAVREETTKNFKRWLVSVGAMSEPTRK